MVRSNLLVQRISRSNQDENSEKFPYSKKWFAIGDSRMNSADERTFFHGRRNFRDKEQRKRKELKQERKEERKLKQ